MFTVEQSAQVKQVFIKHFGRFVTEQELVKIYAEDYAGFLAVKEEAEIETYAVYFGDIFEDPFGEAAFLDTVEFALAS